MYIHGYQIHNVLNVYRKQLSHAPRQTNSDNPPAPGGQDRITISENGQRQTIMEKITTEIVARITQSGPKNDFEAILADRLAPKPEEEPGPSDDGDSAFKYTVIDDQNQRSTHTLNIRGFGTQISGVESSGENHIGKKPVSDMETQSFEHLSKRLREK